MKYIFWCLLNRPDLRFQYHKVQVYMFGWKYLFGIRNLDSDFDIKERIRHKKNIKISNDAGFL